MDIQRIYELLDRFEASGIAELELDMEGAHLHLKKESTLCAQPACKSEEQSYRTPVPKTAESREPAPKTDLPETKEVRALLAGSFYHAPSPGAEPFVKKGQKIHKGDVVGIIEAMKLMNEITAPEDGVVEEIVAGDGALVAYDEVLIRYV